MSNYIHANYGNGNGFHYNCEDNLALYHELKSQSELEINGLKAENAAQAKRIAELEEKLHEITITSGAKIHDLNAKIDSLRRQSDEMLSAMRRAVLALAFAAEKSKVMQDDYQALSNAIAKAVASNNGE